MANEVKPVEWVLPNRIGYNEKIYKTFKPSNYLSTIIEKPKCECDGDVCDLKEDNSIKLFPQQRFVKDYMQFDSPYRGALLYHELGSGKSGASIAAAEGYIEKKKIFVLSPASLAVNYENEILKISSIGLNLKDWKLLKTNKKSLDVLESKYAIKKTIIKKDGLVWVPLYQNDIPDAIIIRETSSTDDKHSISAMTSHIIKNRYTFISYNGLSAKLIKSLGTSPFDNSFVIIDEVHNFISRVVNGSVLARTVYNHLMNARDMKIILLSGTPMINNPYEIATLINLIRGYMNVYQLNYTKASKIMTTEEFQNQLNTTINYIDEFNIDNENRKILISLLPKGYKRNADNMIIKENWGVTVDKMLENIINSLNELKGIKIGIRYSILNYNALPNSKDDFNKYFLDSTDEDNPSVINEDLFMRRILGTVSYYSISGSDLFPSVLPSEVRILDMTDSQFKNYVEARNYELKQDLNKRKGGLFTENSSVYRAFTRAICNFSFPENITRIYPKDIKKHFKNLEANDSDDEDKPEKETNIADEYTNQLKDMMDKLNRSDALTLENLKNHHSPKFAKIVEDIENSPGSVLVYSAFRSVEGLGILSDVLNRQGYKQIELKKVAMDYYFADDDIFDEKYDNKRYVIFDQDKEKTKLLMNLFNSDYSNITNEMKKMLPENPEQLYGKLVKLFCITQSGAEGISLKNVRRVLLVEPFWNNVRIEQVIGRAIRSCSHQALPLKDRNVQVFSYIMKFTKKQKESDFNIERNDKGLTTDEHILQTADKKKYIINKFLNMLKSASFDCVINAKQNKPLLNTFKCYKWAIGVNNNDFSYTNDITNDYKIMKHKKMEVQKRGKGRVVQKRGVKYVELDGKYYDYFSYVNAGILIPEVI
uniref:Helicase ATP-binding domain-containing protein n=1 Tax=viral metagenome TaxID=1070528 RepID=A0A6C0DMD4_9ZZZZ